MIKSDLVYTISLQNKHLYHGDAERIINTILNEIIETLANGDRVELRGFGAFSVKRREAHYGRNPRTGETILVKAKRVPYFKCGMQLHEKLNQVEPQN